MIPLHIEKVAEPIKNVPVIPNSTPLFGDTVPEIHRLGTNTVSLLYSDKLCPPIMAELQAPLISF